MEEKNADTKETEKEGSELAPGCLLDRGEGGAGSGKWSKRPSSIRTDSGKKRYYREGITKRPKRERNRLKYRSSTVPRLRLKYRLNF